MSSPGSVRTQTSTGTRFSGIKTFPAHRVGKWVVLVIWIVIAGWAATNAANLATVENNNATAFLPSNAESTQVFQILETQPGANATPASVLYQRESGITAADKQKVAEDIDKIKTSGVVTGKVTGPVPSQDGKALLISVPMTFSAGDQITKDLNTLDASVGNYDSSDPQASGHVTVDGLDIWTTGPAAQAGDLVEVSGNVDSTLLLVSVAVVIVMLLLTYRSPTLWFFPLVSVGIALALAQSVNYILSKDFGLVVNFSSSSILLVLVFGAGTDYALLITARYREELRNYQDKHEAMAVALTGAGPAILASGATVSIGMLCLLVSTLASDRGLGPVAAVGIVCALLVMLTLYPAMLTIVGRGVFWPRRPMYGQEFSEANGVWYKIGHRVAKNPRPVWIVSALLLFALACLNIPFLNANGLTNAQSFTKPQISVQGQVEMAKHYPAGASSPVLILASPASVATAEKVVATITTSGDSATLLSKPTVIDDYLFFTAALKEAPDTSAGQAEVVDLRTQLQSIEGVNAIVGGSTATSVDVNVATDHDRSIVIPLVIFVVFIVISILLRALVASFMLMMVGLLSFATALGISVTLFNLVFGQTAQDTSYPLYVFIFLVALGVDYNIFLMHRVKEEALTRGTRGGILEGLAVTGGVITSAGLVLAATFATLAVLPITTTFQLGLTVAIGVLLDTFLVRTVFFPALGLDVGWRIWWPGKQYRVDADRPDVDVREPVDGVSGRSTK